MRRLLLIWFLLLAGIACISQSEAFWQSRDSNYNQNVVSGGGGTTTFNPLTTVQTLSNGNLTVTFSNVCKGYAQTVTSYSTGKKYAEVSVVTSVGAYAVDAGILNSSVTGGCSQLGLDTNSGAVFSGDPGFYINNSIVGSTVTYAQADLLGIAVDIPDKLIWYQDNGGNWNGNASSNPANGSGDCCGVSFASISGPYFFGITLANATDSMTANFGATSYAHTPPTGYGNW